MIRNPEPATHGSPQAAPSSVARPAAKRTIPVPGAVVVAAVAGFCLDLAYPETGWWPLAFASVTVSLWLLRGRSLPASFVISLTYGATFYVTHLSWVSTFLGPLPWAALSGLQALLFAAGGPLITLAYRYSRGRLWALAPAWVAGVGVLRETVMGTWPYGGFPWARLGVVLVDTLFAEAASWLGTTGLSFLIVFLCAGALDVALRRRLSHLVALTLIGAVAALVPAFPTTYIGDLRVGWVQGNGPSAYFDPRSEGDIFDAQQTATTSLIGEDLDLLVWPEGSVDSDPLREADTAERLDALTQTIGSPLLVNSATTREGLTFNTSLLWTGTTAPQAYDKANPVPFGEYVPDRWFYELLAPDLVGMIQREYTPGTNLPAMSVAGSRVGLAICFDVIYDRVIHDSAVKGAEVYVFQTNNADFRGTDENLQQLAIARMRALETGRTVVNVSTTGTSQVIRTDGTTAAAVPADTAAAKVSSVPLHRGITPAVILMPWIGPAIGGLSVLMLMLSIAERRLRSRSPHVRSK